jgi:hypothetical protein
MPVSHAALLTPGLLKRAVTHLRMRRVRVVGDETSFGLAAALLRSMAAPTALGKNRTRSTHCAASEAKD